MSLNTNVFLNNLVQFSDSPQIFHVQMEKSLQGSHRRSCENVDFVISPPAIEIRIRIHKKKKKKKKKKGKINSKTN